LNTDKNASEKAQIWIHFILGFGLFAFVESNALALAAFIDLNISFFHWFHCLPTYRAIHNIFPFQNLHLLNFVIPTGKVI
jgi:hypothetical protein